MCDHSNESIKNWFAVVLVTRLHRTGLTFKSVDEILVCNHSNDANILKVRPFKGMPLTFTLVLFVSL